MFLEDPRVTDAMLKLQESSKLDEAAIRADERERLAKKAEDNAPSGQVLRALTPHLSWPEIAQFIRSQGEE